MRLIATLRSLPALPTLRRSTRVATIGGGCALALLLVLPSLEVAAQQRSWSASLPLRSAPDIQRFLMDAAVGLPDGSTLIVGQAPAGFHWTLRLSRAGDVMAAHQDTRAFSTASAVRFGPDSVLLHDMARPWPDMPESDCETERALTGVPGGRRIGSNVLGGSSLSTRITQSFVTSAGDAIVLRERTGHTPAPFEVLRFGRDCHQEVLMQSDSRMHIADGGGGEVVILIEGGSETSTARGTHLLRWGPTVPTWSAEVTQPHDVHAGFSLTSAPDGGVTVALLGAPVDPRIELRRFDRHGTLRWSRIASGTGRLSALLSDDDAVHLVVTPGDGSSDQVESFSHDGRLRWTATLEHGRFGGVLPTPRSDVQRAWIVRHGDFSTRALVRPGTAGLVTLRDMPDSRIHVQSEAADGSLLALQVTRPNEPPRLVRLPTDVDQPEPIDVRLPTNDIPAVLFEDPSGILLALEHDDETLTLQSRSHAGELHWTTTLDPHGAPEPSLPRLMLGDLRLAANARWVCAWRVRPHDDLGAVRCLDRASGSRTGAWTPLPSQSDFYGSQRSILFLPAEAARVVGVSLLCTQGAPFCTWTRILHGFAIASDGSLTAETPVPLHSQIDIDGPMPARASPNGEWLALSGNVDLQVFTNSGTLHRRGPGPGTDGYPSQIDVLDDASVFASNQSTVEAYDALGALRWSWTGATLDRAFTDLRGMPDGSAIAVDVDPTRRHWGVLGLDPNGTERWRRPLAEREPQFALAHVMPARNRFTVSPGHISPSQRRVLRSLDDGLPREVLAGSHHDPHREPPNDVIAARADGTVLRLRVDVYRREATLESFDTGVGPSAPPADAALLGAWAASDTPGQGIFLDHEADIGLYGAWFTYRREGGFDPADLRWYTLVEEGSDATPPTRRLAIYRNRGGAFAAGTTTAERVGEARLRAEDCGRVTLIYVFDAGIEAGQDGAIPLQRAAPSNRDCSSDAALAVAARGLDPRSSGAWFDPATSGQGIAFDLRPPSGADPGLFAGAWFTFDVGGAPDDPTAQHWFTLAGPLGDANAGRLTVPIYRTFGAALDLGATDNTWRVGEATLTFTACDVASVEYRFEDDPIAHAFRAQQGQRWLQRVGGCGD